MTNYSNNVRLTGHLGADPEIKEVANGKKMLRVSLATNDRYRNANGDWENDTQWHQIIFWGKLAVHASLNLKKGQGLSIIGKLVHRSYIDKDDQVKFITEVAVQDWLLIQKKE